MRAAIYARYSSENQRPESLDDQIAACRRLACERGFSIRAEHVYTDQAKSGAQRDRDGLTALLKDAAEASFGVVLVDDLSRLARDNYLMLSILAQLHFEGIRVIAVADGLDSDDVEATLGIQIRGIFNELQLRDLRNKTLRGQIGQKQRGYSVGERTFGYRSVPVGEIRMDKKGRPRPDGYRMQIEPAEAATVLRVFKAFADGRSITSIVQALNREGVRGRFRSSGGWSPATVSRMLDNEKYVGRWIWNRSESRRDPHTGRRRRFEKPESEWIVEKDERLRIVPGQLWDTVRERRRAIRRTWPGGQNRGFSKRQGSRQQHYPTHLLAGAMSCGICGSTIAQVSGKAGGYYGCLKASRGACPNKILAKRSLAEDRIVGAVRDRLRHPETVAMALEAVERAVSELASQAPEEIHLKDAELASEEKRLANFLDFIGEGRGSRALGAALLETEHRVDELKSELASLRAAGTTTYSAPSVVWIRARLEKLHEILERDTQRSAVLLRRFLGPIRLEPLDLGTDRARYRAVTSIDALELVEAPLEDAAEHAGSTPLRPWR